MAGRLREFSIVVALGEDDAIGAKGQLPWNLPGELAHFRALTSRKAEVVENAGADTAPNHAPNAVIMGRKTWDSLPAMLAGRTNIVITRQVDHLSDEADNSDIFFVESFDSALRLASEKCYETFVIGGSEIYKIALKSVFLRHIYATRVPNWARSDEEPDTFFRFDKKKFVNGGIEILDLSFNSQILRETWIRQTHPSDLQALGAPG